MAGDRRDPVVRARVPRHQPALPAIRRRLAAGVRRGPGAPGSRRTRSARVESPTSPPRARSGTRARSPDGRGPRTAHPGPAHRSGDSRRAGSTSRRRGPKVESFATARAGARGTRGGVAAAPRRVRLRHRRRALSSSARRSLLVGCRPDLPARAALALGAGGRGRRRAGRLEAARPEGPTPQRASPCASCSPTSTRIACARSTTRESLGIEDTRAVLFAFDEREPGCGGVGTRPASRMQLERAKAPYRDLGTPLLALPPRTDRRSREPSSTS